MRTVEQSYKIYTFDELSDEAKEKAIDNVRGGDYLDYEWWDGVYCDVKEIGEILGIENMEIMFSGFWNQGDGACFTGDYSYKNGSVKAAKEYAPLDTELHDIAEQLQKAQKTYFYQLSSAIKHNGMYCHEQSVTIDVNHAQDINLPTGRNYRDDTGIDEALRCLMQWIYSRLEKEYYWLIDEEQVTENIKANEYEFYEDGTQY